MQRFSSLRAILGNDYTPAIEADQSKVEKHLALFHSEHGDYDTTESWAYGIDGEPIDMRRLSPAQYRMSRVDTKHDKPAQVLEALYEALEMPGTAYDYDSCLSTAVRALWKLRGEDPSLLNWFEHLCLLNVALVRTPEASVYIAQERIYPSNVFGRLAKLYEREGMLHSAAVMAAEEERYGGHDPSLSSIREKATRLDSGHGAS